MQMLSLVKIGESEIIDIAKGKYEYNGRIFESLQKIIDNNRDERESIS